MPATCTRTPFGGVIPVTSRRNFSLVKTRLQGSTPSSKARPGAVDVGEERLEDPDPLADAPRDEVPLRRVDDPRDEVGGHGPFLARVVVGDAAVGEHPGQLVRAVPQLGRVHRLEHRDKRVVGGARLAGGREHLVPGLGEPVTIENVRHDPQGR